MGFFHNFSVSYGVPNRCASVFQQLSVVKTLNGTNFDDWQESLNMYLTISKDDLALREPRPANLTDRSSAADKRHYRLWHESNRVCLTVLKYTIDKTIRQSIPEKDTAIDYLKAISVKFKKFDKSQKAYYLSLLDNTLYDGASGVREQMMKLVNYFNKLKSFKVDLGESYLVYKVLQSLAAEYGVLRTTYNSQEAEWSIDQMMSIVTQEEESLKKAKSCTHSVNNITEGSSRKGGHDKYKGKKHQNKRSFGPKKDNKKDKGKMKKSFKGNCFYCKRSGHNISECFKLKNKREKEVIPLDIAPLALVCLESNNFETSLDSWWLDSGAIVHLTNSLQGLKNRRSPSEREKTILGVQGSSAEVECVGTVILNLYSGHELILYDVVYVPSSRRSLVSTSVLDKQDIPYGKEVLILLLDINAREFIRTPLCYGTVVWVIFLEIDWKGRARSKRVSRSESILDLIHTDISGPISPATLGNYKYFITSIDDYSRWIDLLHEKSDSLDAFKAFKAAVELKSGKVIKCVRSDRGGEFYGRYTEIGRNPGPFALFLQEHGSRGCRFYCPNYSTRVIESDRLFYCENDSDSGSNIPRVINLHNEDTLFPLSSQTSSSVAHVPVLDGENRDDILVENPIDPVVVPPIVDLRRSQRNRKGAIPDDYIVYLQEFENSSRTKHFDVKFLFVREKIAESQTCLVHIPGEHMLADPLTKDVETSLH
ncbi:Retrovirus-related Pol polyprotein from transposon TNT 1-94 [Senna tora]|uniref:Retrovirus-related Pol polyprotein from transposon TNT 1-94 n=1 Tax=Senna tora TaxID=362788 RepID=A0A834W8B9_9FABA|nr:Retrovirus-related Pol polyprotein from transposon TNT 1-94 [Senna tora]